MLKTGEEGPPLKPAGRERLVIIIKFPLLSALHCAYECGYNLPENAFFA